MSPREPEGRPARRPQDWPLEEILEAVLEASRLSGEELGAFRRRKGIHQAHPEGERPGNPVLWASGWRGG